MKTCFDFENGIPRGEFFDCASMDDKAKEKPLIASGDFFKYSNRFKQRSIRGVAIEGIAMITHLLGNHINENLQMQLIIIYYLRHHAAARRTDCIG